jgi:hypothetical protein
VNGAFDICRVFCIRPQQDKKVVIKHKQKLLLRILCPIYILHKADLVPSVFRDRVKSISLFHARYLSVIEFHDCIIVRRLHLQIMGELVKYVSLENEILHVHHLIFGVRLWMRHLEKARYLR